MRGGKMRQRRILICLCISALGQSFIGCSGFKAVVADIESGRPAGFSGGGINSSVNMDALNANLVEIDEALISVDGDLDKINLQMLSDGAAGSGSSQKSVENSLRNYFDKLLLSAQNTYTEITRLRSEVIAQISSMDRNQPEYTANRNKLNDVLAYLDQLEMRLDDAYRDLIARIENLVTGIDGQIAKLDSKSPVTWAILVYWQNIKLTLLEYRGKLINLVP